MKQVEVLSLGGGTQSTLCLLLVCLGELPKPDYIVIVDTGYEIGTTWEYLEKYTIPLAKEHDLTIHKVSKDNYSTYGLYDSRGYCLMPMYVEEGGMLNKYCSGNWKRDVLKRFVSKQSGKPQTHQRHWIGYGLEETRRWKAKRGKPEYYFPLVEKGIRKEEYPVYFDKFSLPLPDKSACYCCPFRTDFSTLTEEEVRLTQELENEINENHSFVGWEGKCFFHKLRKPFSQALSEDNSGDETCDEGGCFT